MSPLVLLHGFLGAPAAWDGVLDALRHQGPVLAPALSGHAGAPVVGSFQAEVDRLAAAIDDAGLRDAHLVGYSLGGRLALGLLASRPELFSRATLLSVHPGLRTEAERQARRESDQAWAARLERDGLDPFLDAWEAQPLFAAQAALPEPVRVAWRRLRTTHDPASVVVGLGALSLGAMPDYTGCFADLSAPITVLTGDLDLKFQALTPALCALFPRSARHNIAGAGHNLPLEAPSAVAAALHRSPP